MSTGTVTHPDLRAAWAAETAQQLARPPQPGGSFGPPGWLADIGVIELLAPCFRGPVSVGDGLVEVPAVVGPDLAAGLLGALPPGFVAEELMGDSVGPSLGQILRAIVAHPDDVCASAYLVGPLRHDERISIETLHVRVPDHVGVNDFDREDDEDGYAEDVAEVVWRYIKTLGLEAEHPAEDTEPQDTETKNGRWWTLWWD